MEPVKPKSNRAPVGNIACENTTMNLLKANDFVAKVIRERLSNMLVVNVCSSPGSGKTTLMQETGKLLRDKLNMAVLVGDPETERDAIRMRDVGINALQIVTGRHVPHRSANDLTGSGSYEFRRC